MQGKDDHFKKRLFLTLFSSAVQILIEIVLAYQLVKSVSTLSSFDHDPWRPLKNRACWIWWARIISLAKCRMLLKPLNKVSPYDGFPLQIVDLCLPFNKHTYQEITSLITRALFFSCVGIDSDPWRSLKWWGWGFLHECILSIQKLVEDREKGYVFHVSHWAKVRINV